MDMKSSEIRKSFLQFFQERGHTVVPSSSLVPAEDPSLLFTNAGMVQFKNVFLGLETRPYARAVSVQKCLRAGGKHNDLEQVGPSGRHHTFFEMLGNFSFGDYFKREAIAWAWQFLMGVLNLDPQSLWPTVYQDDDEAYELWHDVAGVPYERITRMGFEDNFWMMADTGPCGPCSEIILDRGPEKGCGHPQCPVGHDCGRWWELWNLVFMQYEQHEDGTCTPLPRPNIDTGMGLERITAVMQGVDTNYETDLFWPIIERTRELTSHSWEQVHLQIASYRVIADHSRAVAFLIADGILPGNEGRNYVLRRILRRAVRHGRKLGLERPFLGHTIEVVAEIMGDHYPEVRENLEFIVDAVREEEERFHRTLSQGMARFELMAGQILESKGKVISGGDAFRLYDTYGFPLDLTMELAAEWGLSVDVKGFEEALEAQRLQSQAGAQFAGPSAEALEVYGKLGLPTVVFTGYFETESAGRVLAILVDGEPTATARKGQQADMILDRTPFYVEAGGQVADIGVIEGHHGIFEVERPFRPLEGLIVHRGRMVEGEIHVGDEVVAKVDTDRRMDTARNHTATHLLHQALRRILGTHVRQAGSLVAPDRLRFDFTHLAPLTHEQLVAVEEEVNARIRDDLELTTLVTEYDKALAMGALAFFGEKYGSIVRVVAVDEYSRELCGGTHVQRTGQIGTFIITYEGSIGSGLRRIEALTGRGATRFARQRLDLLDSLARDLRCEPEALPERISRLRLEFRELERNLERLGGLFAASQVEALIPAALTVDGLKVIAAQVEAPSMEHLRGMAEKARSKLGEGVVVLGAVIDGKPNLVVMASPGAASRGVHAGRLARTLAPVIGGGGGGRAELAQAGGKDPSRLKDALAQVPVAVRAQLSETSVRG
jgi:alanyl-tRNA synthetase